MSSTEQPQSTHEALEKLCRDLAVRLRAEGVRPLPEGAGRIPRSMESQKAELLGMIEHGGFEGVWWWVPVGFAHGLALWDDHELELLDRMGAGIRSPVGARDRDREGAGR